MDDWNQQIREHDQEELRRAIADARDQQLADMFALWFGLACERYPDIMKAAVGGLFDLRAVEETTKRTNANVLSHLEQARAIHKKLNDACYLVEKRITALENRIAKCEAYLERAAKNMAQLNGVKK